MPSYAYWDDDYEPDSDKRYLNKREIERCDDVAQLMEWWEALEDTAESVRGQLEAHRICGADDDGWVYSACQVLAFTGMGLNRVKRQLRKYGVAVFPEGDMIAETSRKLQVAKAQASVGHEISELVRERYGPSVADEFTRLAKQTVENRAAAKKLKAAA